MANAYTGNVRLFRRGCGALAAGPCLAGRRFRVEVGWRAGNQQGPGLPLDIGSADSQLFSFFDPNNWEVLAKVLDGCAINGHFWVYAAASTDLAYDLTVTDTWTGRRSVYRNAAGVPAPAITDSGAFPTCDAVSPNWNPPELTRAPLVERPGELQLAQGFKAKVSWTTPAGLEGSGTGLETVPRQASGLFYFFDRSNWEMQVKVLDGCAINGHRWVFRGRHHRRRLYPRGRRNRQRAAQDRHQPGRPSLAGDHRHRGLLLQLSEKRARRWGRREPPACAAVSC